MKRWAFCTLQRTTNTPYDLEKVHRVHRSQTTNKRVYKKQKKMTCDLSLSESDSSTDIFKQEIQSHRHLLLLLLLYRGSTSYSLPQTAWLYSQQPVGLSSEQCPWMLLYSPCCTHFYICGFLFFSAIFQKTEKSLKWLSQAGSRTSHCVRLVCESAEFPCISIINLLPGPLQS